jgi:hypothetical protein
MRREPPSVRAIAVLSGCCLALGACARPAPSAGTASASLRMGSCRAAPDRPEPGVRASAATMAWIVCIQIALRQWLASLPVPEGPAGDGVTAMCARAARDLAAIQDRRTGRGLAAPVQQPLIADLRRRCCAVLRQARSREAAGCIQALMGEVIALAGSPATLAYLGWDREQIQAWLAGLALERASLAVVCWPVPTQPHAAHGNLPCPAPTSTRGP